MIEMKIFSNFLIYISIFKFLFHLHISALLWNSLPPCSSSSLFFFLLPLPFFFSSFSPFLLYIPLAFFPSFFLPPLLFPFTLLSIVSFSSSSLTRLASSSLPRSNNLLPNSSSSSCHLSLSFVICHLSFVNCHLSSLVNNLHKWHHITTFILDIPNPTFLPYHFYQTKPKSLLWKFFQIPSNFFLLSQSYYYLFPTFSFFLFHILIPSHLYILQRYI